ncbi:uncharacterized protein LOC125647239 [Ostrea edulis]|uniref:uncharacterized protein LOC125647239 n=1 Tax=Ostrea edulis TaxID=37623 RepID=UPI0024AE9418|nr:uncharacterized protein LOC125647239 [Ostrea edulis]
MNVSKTLLIALVLVICAGVFQLIGWLKAVQAMSILGFLVLVVAVLMTVFKLFVKKDKNQFLFVAIGTSFAGAIFILISIAVYADKINDQIPPQVDYNYHFNFTFSIIGMMAAIVAGVAMLVEMKQT